jgi:hypothetical protein
MSLKALRRRETQHPSPSCMPRYTCPIRLALSHGQRTFLLCSQIGSKSELGDEDDSDSEELNLLLEEANRMIKLGESRAGSKFRARSKSRGAEDLIGESGGLITGGRRGSLAGGSSREGSFNSGRKVPHAGRAKTDQLPRRGLGTVSEVVGADKGFTPTPPAGEAGATARKRSSLKLTPSAEGPRRSILLLGKATSDASMQTEHAHFVAEAGCQTDESASGNQASRSTAVRDGDHLVGAIVERRRSMDMGQAAAGEDGVLRAPYRAARRGSFGAANAPLGMEAALTRRGSVDRGMPGAPPMSSTERRRSLGSIEAQSLSPLTSLDSPHRIRPASRELWNAQGARQRRGARSGRPSKESTSSAAGDSDFEDPSAVALLSEAVGELTDMLNLSPEAKSQLEVKLAEIMRGLAHMPSQEHGGRAASADKRGVAVVSREDIGIQVNYSELRARMPHLNRGYGGPVGGGEMAVPVASLSPLQGATQPFINAGVELSAAESPIRDSDHLTLGLDANEVRDAHQRLEGTPASAGYGDPRRLDVMQPTNGQSYDGVAMGQPGSNEMQALLGVLGLPHLSPRSAWKTNAGWQPRHIALRPASKSSPRAVLAAIPAEAKPLLDRVIQAANAAAQTARARNGSAARSAPSTPRQVVPLSKPLAMHHSTRGSRRGGAPIRAANNSSADSAMGSTLL